MKAILFSCVFILLLTLTISQDPRPWYTDVNLTNADVIRWINVARAYPKDMAHIIEFLLDNYYQDGAIFMNGIPQPTSQKDRAYKEAIEVLKTMEPVPALKNNNLLKEVAESHNKDMIKNNYLNHTNLLNQSSSDRIKSKASSSENFTSGENLAMLIDLQGPDFALIGVINLLTDDGYKYSNGSISRGHRQNLLKPSWRYVGTAIEMKENDIIVKMTQLFSIQDIDEASTNETFIDEGGSWIERSITYFKANKVFNTEKWGNKEIKMPKFVVSSRSSIARDGDLVITVEVRNYNDGSYDEITTTNYPDGTSTQRTKSFN